MFVEVLLELPVERSFTYRLSGYESHPAEFGKRVLVPFGRRDLLKTGIILKVMEKPPESPASFKEVFDIPDPFPLITEEVLETARWVASFYCSSLGEALFRFLPEAFKVEESVVISLKEDFPKVKLSPAEEAVVRELLNSSSGKLKLSTLRKRLKIKTLSAVISRLVKKGIVESLTEIEKEKVPKEAYLKFLFQGEYRGERGKKLLEILKERRELSVREAKSLGFSDSVIRNLVEKGFAKLYYKKITVENRENPLKDWRLVNLTPAQREAFEGILKGGRAHLLTGITGSGKMEVYLAVAREMVKRGKGVLILVPELLLTPELRSRLEAYFGSRVGIYHGKLTPRERASTWLKALRGEVKVFLGTRPAALLPIKNLGLIVVDEEQDSSFKDNQKPYYNARDVALKRSEITGAKIVLVSATPSVDSFYLYKRGVLQRHHLKERYLRLPLPKIELLDLTAEERRGIFSVKLLKTLDRVVKAGKQALLYIPRRGFFSSVFCESCGWSAECKYCKVNLAYHKSMNLLICHICGKRYRPIFKCPKCSSRLSFRGYGTERVEEELREIFPHIKVVRLDLDTVKEPTTGARLIKEIKEGKYQVIVGTNIAVKGHNFPKLAFVGVLVAELLGGAPDFKASERTFQSIIQATGRAGRFTPGSAIVQAFNPELPAVKFATNYQFEDFYETELFGREILGYPPFTLGVLLEFQIERKALEKRLKEKYESLAAKLQEHFNFPKLNPAPIPKLSGRYRYIAFLTTGWEGHLEKLNRLKMSIGKIFSTSAIKYKINVQPSKIL